MMIFEEEASVPLGLLLLVGCVNSFPWLAVIADLMSVIKAARSLGIASVCGQLISSLPTDQSSFPKSIIPPNPLGPK